MNGTGENTNERNPAGVDGMDDDTTFCMALRVVLVLFLSSYFIFPLLSACYGYLITAGDCGFTYREPVLLRSAGLSADLDGGLTELLLLLLDYTWLSLSSSSLSFAFALYVALRTRGWALISDGSSTPI